MENRYDNIEIVTNKETYLILLEDLPEAVQNYLDNFMKTGWTPEIENAWQDTLKYFEELYSNETVIKIVGHSFYDDIVYDGGGN